MKYNYLTMLTALILLAGMSITCEQTPAGSQVALPVNLTTTITVNEGTVEIQASADGANFYSFLFEENGDTTYVEAEDGYGSYTYSSSGSYTVISRAHTLAYEYVEVMETVTIALADDPVTGIPETGYSTPLEYPGYTLVWHDEFEGTSLSADWVHDIGTGASGWGNNELQYYRPENTTVNDGLLIITAKQENFGGRNYTSSRIKTQGQQAFSKGRIDIRAALPYGQGIWPALWMLGENFPTVGWPACGEIDIMELVGGAGTNDRTVHGTVHWLNAGAHASYSGSNTLSEGKFADAFHVFSIIWNDTSIKWLRDDMQYHAADITPAELSEFQNAFFFILNIAVGGNWPGSPDATTVFPQTMAVDYVRVFQQ